MAPGGEHTHDHPRSSTRRHLLIAFVITITFMFVEAIGGLLFNSLALLADAGHMLTDAGALGISLLALRLAARAPSTTHTFGLRRFEILAALINGLALWAVVGVIMREAVERFRDPPAVEAQGMIVVAVLGLTVNLVAIGLLHGHKDESLNIRGAFLHVMADSLGSAGTILAGLAILFTGWFFLDPLVSLLICLIILWSSWKLVRDSVHILLMGAPAHLDYRLVEQEILRYPGVCCLYDLHIWSISSRQEVMSAHIVVPEGFSQQKELLRDIVAGLRKRFKIEHVTLQLEESHELRDLRTGACKVDPTCSVCDRPDEIK
jgi:cobalt-zinc-cadmium efflux system protein